MALVPAGNGAGYFLTWTGIDRNNEPTTKEWEMTAADAATALADAAIIIPQWQLLTQCDTVAYSVALRMEENAIVTPAAGERQTKAVVTTRLEGGNEKATLEIPAPVETLFRALTGDDNKIVNITFLALTEFVNNFITAQDNRLFISDGEKVAEILRGRKR
jgi:hypothetical protein